MCRPVGIDLDPDVLHGDREPASIPSPRTLREYRLQQALSATIGRDLAARASPHDPKMTTIQIMSDTLPLAEVKAKFSEMVDRVERTHDRITVTRNGRRAVVLISPEELESLEDTLDLLSDPVAMAQLHESRLAHDAGDVVTAEELRSQYLKR